jgi:hypothetical protein
MGRHGGGEGARAAARAAALRSDALGQRDVAASDRGARTRGRSDTGPGGHGAPLWHGATAVPPRAANPGVASCGLAADMRPHMSANLKYQKNSKISSPHKKNRYKVRKNLRKLMEVGNPIWNTFHDYNFFRFSMNFELFQRF